MDVPAQVEESGGGPPPPTVGTETHDGIPIGLPTVGGLFAQTRSKGRIIPGWPKETLKDVLAVAEPSAGTVARRRF